MRTFARFTHAQCLALLLALFALTVTTEVTTAATPGYTQPLLSTGYRHESGAPSASSAPDTTVNETTTTSNEIDVGADTTDVAPNVLPDPRAGASAQTSSTNPNALPDPRPAAAGVSLPAGSSPASVPTHR